MSYEAFLSELVKTELNADNKREEIHKVKQKINQVESEIIKTSNEYKKEKAEMDTLIKELTDAESEYISQTLEVNVLKEQKENLQISVNGLQIEKVSKQLEIETATEEFHLSVQNFCCNYGLHADAVETRERKLKVEQSENKKEQNELLHEIESLKSQTNKNEAYLSQQVELENEISSLQSKVIDADTQLVKKRQENQLLNKELEDSKRNASTDMEYNRLQSELNSLKNSDIESEIEMLNQELSNAKRRSWQNSVRTKIQADVKYSKITQN